MLIKNSPPLNHEEDCEFIPEPGLDARRFHKTNPRKSAFICGEKLLLLFSVSPCLRGEIYAGVAHGENVYGRPTMGKFNGAFFKNVRFFKKP